MKHIPIYLLAAAMPLYLASCGWGSVCNCQYKMSTRPWDTTISIGHDISMSTTEGKCLAIQAADTAFDTCYAKEDKD